MKTGWLIALMLLSLILLQGCATMLNTKTLQIEVLQPGKVFLPDGLKHLAVRYNNSNVAYNPELAKYTVNQDTIPDKSNLDSLASHVYFDLFVETVKEQGFFDSVSKISPGDFSATEIVDTIDFPDFVKFDSTDNLDLLEGLLSSNALSKQLSEVPPSTSGKTKQISLDSRLGIYSPEELKAIADFTGADYLFSLDHFYTTNSIRSQKEWGGQLLVTETVHINVFWTIYDLAEQKLRFYYRDDDSVQWEDYCTFERHIEKTAPPRKDAVLTAADLKGSDFAKFLIPHWITAERMYYQSHFEELKNIDALIRNQKWLEAAALWKEYAESPNKKIAAKCMYNLALANEISGNMDAAIDWLVKSYHVFGEKNPLHASNCKLYIDAIGRRRITGKILDKQFSD